MLASGLAVAGRLRTYYCAVKLISFRKCRRWDLERSFALETWVEVRNLCEWSFFCNLLYWFASAFVPAWKKLTCTLGSLSHISRSLPSIRYTPSPFPPLAIPLITSKTRPLSSKILLGLPTYLKSLRCCFFPIFHQTLLCTFGIPRHRPPFAVSVLIWSFRQGYKSLINSSKSLLKFPPLKPF